MCTGLPTHRPYGLTETLMDGTFDSLLSFHRVHHFVCFRWEGSHFATTIVLVITSQQWLLTA